jgi:deazaflavin-dependent oxidoreductase (nitroreductase family)
MRCSSSSGSSLPSPAASRSRWMTASRSASEALSESCLLIAAAKGSAHRASPALLSGTSRGKLHGRAGHHGMTASEADITQSTVRRRFFWVLKKTLNRLTARMARAGHGPFSVIRHVGRKSGRTYETPVILAGVPQGFVAELTYGDNVDWYRNIVAAGGCIVIHHGKHYVVTRIEPCSAEQGRSAYPTPFRQVLRVAARKEFRLLRTDTSQTAD